MVSICAEPRNGVESSVKSTWTYRAQLISLEVIGNSEIQESSQTILVG